MVLDIPFDIKQIANILDRLPDPVVVYFPLKDQPDELATDFQIRYCNQVARKALKITADSSLSESTFLDELTKNHIVEQCNLVLKRKEPMTFEFYSPALDRQVQVVRTPAQFGILSVIRYLESPRHGQTPNDRSYLSSLLLDASPSAMMLLEPLRLDGNIFDFKVSLANERMAALLGLSRTTLEQSLCNQLSSELIRNHVSPILRSSFDTGEISNIEAYEDQSKRWFEIKIARTRESFLSISINDITSLKAGNLEIEKMREEMSEALEELNRSNERLTEFTYVASHDLNEPLRKILTFSKMLQEKVIGSSIEGANDYLQRIEKTAVRMQGLLNDLLIYSRVTKRPLRLETLSLATLVKEVLKEQETRIREKEADIQLDVLPDFQGDTAQLKQLFLHLIQNSLKFHPKESKPRIKIQAFELEDVHMIEISDDGIGFDNREATRIFELFYRLHARHEFEGNGVGLAIVQRVVENHNGRIEAVGNPGNGTTFRMIFPRVSAEQK